MTEFSAKRSAATLHRFAIVCAVATFILVFVGGLVPSTGSALAVPDWPLAYGRLVPKLVGGVRFEYGHRVVAGIVVILTIILASWTAMIEPRSWVRKTAYAAAVVIVVQAILGGLTVLYLLPLALAVAHAATAQALFCLMVAMAVFTNPGFGTVQRIEPASLRSRIDLLATITTTIIYTQILIGALMRHLGAGLAIPDFPESFGHLLPPFVSLGIDVNFAHRCGAVVVTLFVLWTVARVFRSYRDRSEVMRPALLLLLLLPAQITLGALTIWSGRAVLPATTHVAIGAAVLATSLVLTIHARTLHGLASRSEADTVRSPISQSMEHKVPA